MVYVFLADGFEEIEAIAPVDILRRGGVQVATVGVGGKTVASDRGIPVVADITDAQLDFDKMEMLVLPGGRGHISLKGSSVVKKAVEFAVESGRYVAAICASPTVLDAFRVIDGKKVTCYPSMSEEIRHATFVNEPVVKDGNIITAMGPAYSLDFGFALLKELKGESAAANAREGMLFGR
jgi:4-methyl-5(b-hydroxyethyl)-thiazole monophosphate biosynthesis